jgi:putative transposase
MNRLITSTAIPARAVKIEALANMTASFESFCLASGIEALAEMMENDARTACGPRHGRGKNRRAHRWGKTKGKIGFHGGKVAIERPRLRGFDGKEQALPSWEGATKEDWLGKWAMNQMLINVSTRKFKLACPRAKCRHPKVLAYRNRPPPGILSRCRRRD